MGGYGTRTPSGLVVPSGYAISDDALSPLDFAPVLWLDASQESGADGAAILPTDRSGNGVAITQATEANRPTLEVGEIAGRNSFGWNGTSQYLDVALSAAVLPVTMFAVVDMTSFAAARCFMATQTLNQGAVFRTTITNGNLVLTVDAASVTSTGVLVAGAVTVLAGRIASDGTTGFWLNGAKDATTTAVADTSPAAVNVRVGANGTPTQYMLGQMPELIRYHTLLTDADIVRLQQEYLMPKWGVA